MPTLFEPYALRDLTLRNRTVVAPMCQYSARHGHANDWHLVHLGRFGIGGFGLVIVEATAVVPEGRISYADLGLWEDAQIEGLKRITDFLRENGAASGIQLAHAGRKASTPVAWRNGFDETEAEKPEIAFEHWTPVGPVARSHAPQNPDYQVPHALEETEIADLIAAFGTATRRSLAAGFDLVEIHAAHGYLINQFLSPLANERTDRYGGSLENRMRLLLEITETVRAEWPEDRPLLVRLSVSDNAPDGWQVEDSVALSRELKARGVDMIDCSSGGFAEGRIKPGPHYQVPFARAVREGAGIASMAVGLIEEPDAANAIISDGEADLVALARGALDDPNWPLHAQRALAGDGDDYRFWPIQARDRIRDRDKRR